MKPHGWLLCSASHKHTHTQTQAHKSLPVFDCPSVRPSVCLRSPFSSRRRSSSHRNPLASWVVLQNSAASATSMEFNDTPRSVHQQTIADSCCIYYCTCICIFACINGKVCQMLKWMLSYESFWHCNLLATRGATVDCQ